MPELFSGLPDSPNGGIISINMATIYQWYAELEYYKPKMWRRFQTSDTISVARLGYIVMALYEMQAEHLISIQHERSLLTPSGRKSSRTEEIARYGFPAAFTEMIDWGDTGDDATAVRVSDINLDASSWLTVWYDFGDDWKVRLTPEAKQADSGDELQGNLLRGNLLQGNLLPRVLEGAGFGIIENCGGPFGLEEIAEAFKRKTGEDYEDYREWLETDDLDLTKFDIDDINFRLKKLPDIFAKIYEKGRMPTAADCNFMERKYQKKSKKREKKAD